MPIRCASRRDTPCKIAGDGILSVLLGILSDSHGRSKAVRRALELFDRLGVEMIVHCGDVGEVGVFDELAGRECRFVWGNMDEPGPGVEAYLASLGIPAPSVGGLTLEIDGKRILVFHGHEAAFRAAVAAASADYILHGHTHEPRDERIGRTRVINPGALHRASNRTVATLDTATDEVRFHPIG